MRVLFFLYKFLCSNDHLFNDMENSLDNTEGNIHSMTEISENSLDNTEGNEVLLHKTLGALAYMQICQQIQQLHNSIYSTYMPDQQI